MNLLLFFALSVLMGKIYKYYNPIWTIGKYKIVIWPCYAAFGIGSIVTFGLYQGVVGVKVFWWLWKMFIVSFPAIFYYAQEQPNKHDMMESIKRLEQYLENRTYLWSIYKKISPSLPF